VLPLWNINFGERGRESPIEVTPFQKVLPLWKKLRSVREGVIGRESLIEVTPFQKVLPLWNKNSGLRL